MTKAAKNLVMLVCIYEKKHSPVIEVDHSIGSVNSQIFPVILGSTFFLIFTVL